jgi:hypothetical protein
MSARLDGSVGRRQFLKRAALVAASQHAWARLADARLAEDAPNTHNMLVFGERTLFLSHLPLFGGLDKTKAAFRSPHRYQLILQTSFAKRGNGVGDIYLKDRRRIPILVFTPSCRRSSC